MEVLEFIDRFCLNQVSTKLNSDPTEVIRLQFRAGYCFHFAHMLKLTFNRGEVCWAAPFSHIVWVDGNEIPYDIEGVYTGDYDYLIPLTYIEKLYPEFTIGYTHRYGVLKDEEIITEYKIRDIIRHYRDDNNILDSYDPYNEYNSIEEALNNTTLESSLE
jgi:hypothetical protein